MMLKFNSFLRFDQFYGKKLLWLGYNRRIRIDVCSQEGHLDPPRAGAGGVTGHHGGLLKILVLRWLATHRGKRYERGQIEELNIRVLRVHSLCCNRMVPGANGSSEGCCSISVEDISIARIPSSVTESRMDDDFEAYTRRVDDFNDEDAVYYLE